MCDDKELESMVESAEVEAELSEAIDDMKTMVDEIASTGEALESLQGDQADLEAERALFEKVNFESELDRLKADASREKPVLDQRFEDLYDDRLYNNNAKLGFTFFLIHGFDRCGVDYDEAATLLSELSGEGSGAAMGYLALITYDSLEREKLLKKALRYGIDTPINLYEAIIYGMVALERSDYGVIPRLLKQFDFEEDPFSDYLLGRFYGEPASPYYSEKRARLHWVSALENGDQFTKIWLEEEKIEVNISPEDLIDSVW